jgi:hypothetical protein
MEVSRVEGSPAQEKEVSDHCPESWVITQFPRIQLPSQGQFRPINRWLALGILPGRAKSPEWLEGRFLPHF